MGILLDENFPLQLYRRLREAGYDAEHVIALGQRGLPDSEIRLRLAAEENLVFITQDTEFGELITDFRATVINLPDPAGVAHSGTRRSLAQGHSRLPRQPASRPPLRSAGDGGVCTTGMTASRRRGYRPES